MSIFVDFYRNPGQTLYDYLSAIYPEIRQNILEHALVKEMFFFENLYHDERQLLNTYPVLPPAEKMYSTISRKELNTLFDLCCAVKHSHYLVNIPFNSRREYLQAWLLLCQTMQTKGLNPGAAATLPGLFFRPYTLDYPSYSPEDLWGYWTKDECQMMYPCLEAIYDPLNNKHHVYKTALLDFLNTDNHLISQMNLMDPYTKVRAMAQLVMHAIDKLRPDEGLIGHVSLYRDALDQWSPQFREAFQWGTAYSTDG